LTGADVKTAMLPTMVAMVTQVPTGQVWYSKARRRDYHRGI
jgi:hypothetical protein